MRGGTGVDGEDLLEVVKSCFLLDEAVMSLYAGGLVTGVCL